jgi:hypothetical protein
MSQLTTSTAQTGLLDAPGRVPFTPEAGAGFLDAFNRAKQNTPTFLAIELAAGRGYERQPGFELTDAKVRPLLQEVPQDLWPAYGDAVSDEHLRDIHVKNLLRLQNRTEIAKSGISGIAGAILADFTDPAMFAAGAFTGGYGFLAKGTQTARAVALARTGLISGTAFGSIEAFRQSQQPTGDPFAVMEAALGGGLGGVASGFTAQSGRLARALAQGSSQAVATPVVRSLDPDADAHQVAVSTGVGFLLGAFGGAISKESAAAMDKSVRWMIRDAEYGDVAASGFTLSEDGKAYFKTQLDPDLNNRRVADAIEIVNEPFDDVAIKRAGSPVPPDEGVTQAVSDEIRMAVGASNPSGVKSPYGKVWTIAPEGDDWRFSANDASARGQWAFVPEPFRAINLRLGDSKSPMARMIGNAWGRDFLPKSDGALAEGASTWIDFTFKKKVRAVNDSLVSAEAELAKNGVKLTKDQFDDAAFLDIAVGNGTAPPAIRRFVDTVRTNFKEMLDYEKRSGVNSAVDVPDDPNYVPHVHIASLIEENVGKHGLDPMIDAYAGAIRSQMVKMGRNFAKGDETLIRSMAKAIIKSGGQVSRGEHARIVSLDVAVVDALRSVGADDAMIARAVDMLEQMAPAADDVKILKRIQQEADPVERAKLEKQLKKRASDTNAPTNLKRRIPLDVAYEHPMPDGSKLKIRDMMEKDLYVLSRNYTRRALGSGVLATTLRGIEPETNPIEPMSSLDDLIRRYRTEAESLGVNRDKIETEAKLIETMGRNILGLPHYDASKPWVVNAVRLSRVARNTVQAMGLSSAWTGLTNFTEPLSAMFTALGPKMLKAMPNLAEIRQRALDGKIDAKMMRMADYYGMAINAGQRRLNTIAEFGAPTKSGTAYGRGLEKAERATGIATNFTQKISLQEITQDMGEFLAFHGIQDRWGQWAASGKVPGRRALLPSGLADQPDMVQRIIDQGKKYHTTFKNSVGATIVDMQVENWDDLAARAAVMNSIRLEVRRKFVDTDLNGMPAFLSEEWAKPLAQFNNFMVASTRAKLGWAVSMKDPEAFQIMAANTALVGTLYMLRVYADSQSQDDPQKYREERLAPGKIFAAAVGRSSWTSLFPRIADTGLALGGQDAVFSAMRTSGIDPSVQVPVLDYARRLSKVPGAIINPALRDDHDFSQADLQTIKRALIPNAINQFGAIDRLANYLNLPEQSKR